MEFRKRGKDVEVFQCDGLAQSGVQECVGLCCSGSCLRWLRDMEEQLKEVGGVEDLFQVEARPFGEQWRDSCFCFSSDVLKDRFVSAVMVERKLVALEHVEVDALKNWGKGI